MAIDHWPREKNWKYVYTRSAKLHRAKQLGFVYPRQNETNLIGNESLKILFICTMNQWRSPTAEKIYAGRPLLLVRSRGTSSKAVRTVRAADLQWADVVFVMEEKHRERLLSEFPGEMRFKELHVLGIPDNFKFMDPELIADLEAVVGPILTGKENGAQ
ncbi:MAG: hypothetical protein C0483_12565 [Pirellula sp.]|nr:hypothetical protein [Pirellula sp.]